MTLQRVNGTLGWESVGMGEIGIVSKNLRGNAELGVSCQLLGGGRRSEVLALALRSRSRGARARVEDSTPYGSTPYRTPLLAPPTVRSQ